MKTQFFIALMSLSTVGLAADMGSMPVDETQTTEQAEPTPAIEEEQEVTWVDDSHAYTTNRAQELTEWMDSFFGDPVYEIEKPESLLRVEWINEWDEQDDYKGRVRLRGKIRLPRLSERVSIIFSGEDGDLSSQRDDSDRDDAEILYNIGEILRQRADVTLGVNSSGLRPGVRYRNQGPISDNTRYRYTQRLEWESNEGFYTTSELNLDYATSDSQLSRWGSEVTYGEETYGAEWRTGFSFRQKYETPTLQDPFVLSYFTTANGFTDPSWVENYRVGMRFRRQMLRKYFFVEVEPSYNFRKNEADQSRDGVWIIELRFEILFQTDRLRTPDTVSAERAAAGLKAHDGFAENSARQVGASEVFLSESRQP